MYRQFLRCKLHQVRVTESNVDYTGSLTIDKDIMDAAGIGSYEKLLVANIENGARFETYAIEGPRGSKKIGLNGAAARLGEVGDKLIVMIFGIFKTDEIEYNLSPKVLMFDADNNITEIIGGDEND